MAKLVDALCSGRSAGNGVLVRIQFWAPNKKAFLNEKPFYFLVAVLQMNLLRKQHYQIPKEFKLLPK